MRVQELDTFENILDILRNLIYEILPDEYYEYIELSGATKWYVDNIIIQLKPFLPSAESVKLIIQSPVKNPRTNIKEYQARIFVFKSLQEIEGNYKALIKEFKKYLSV